MQTSTINRVTVEQPLRSVAERDRFKRAKLVWQAAEEARQAGRIAEYGELIARWRHLLKEDGVK